MIHDLPELIVDNASAWRSWLERHATESSGVSLVLARKGTRTPTCLTYDEALEEALCHGWIDGRRDRRDDTTYQQRFTPRRDASAWSQRNVERAEELIRQGRMQPAGLAAVEAARADGRWHSAYAGSRDIVVPDDFATALRERPGAQAMFESLSRRNRYAVLYRVTAATSEAARARRVIKFADMLARGETIYPQGPQTTR